MDWLVSTLLLGVVIAAVIFLAVMKIVNLFSWNEWLYWLLGAALIALGTAMAIDSERANAERREAAAAPPPEPVALADFDPTQNVATAGEVALRAVLRRDLAFEWKQDTLGVPISYWAAAIDASADARGDVRAVILSNRPESDELSRWRERASLGIGEDPIRGLVRDSRDDKIRESLAAEFAKSGRSLAPDAVLIEPFLTTRADALKPRDSLLMLGVIAGFGAVVFLYGFLRRYLKRRKSV